MRPLRSAGRRENDRMKDGRLGGPGRLRSLDGRRFTGIFLALLAFGLAVAYGHSFGVGFYFDDIYGIRDNAAIRSLWNIPSYFTDSFTLTSLRPNVDVRPILSITYAINYAISGNDPWSYHAFNLIVHFLTAVMVFVLVRDYLWWPASQRGADGAARLPAAAAALFFALAPVNNQALNYMWARSALLCTTFYVAAFLALMNRRMVAALFLQVLALLTKAITLTLPAVFVAYDFLYRDRKRHPDLRAWLKDWKELIPPVLPLAVVNVLYLVYRSWMMPPGAEIHQHERWVTPWIWFISQWSALLHYVRVFVWPSGLSVDNDFPYTMHVQEFAAWGSLLVLVAWVALALRFSRRFPHVAFATLWFFITLAPESTFTPLAEVVNDHRPYIASTLGLSVLLAWVLERAASLAGRHRGEVLVAATLALGIAFVVVGHRRTSDWADDLRLWDSTVAVSPRNGRAWMNAGLARMRRGELKEARRMFEKTRELLPTYAYNYMNLSVIELLEKKPAEAVAWAAQAVRFGPDLVLSHYHLGNALEAQGRLAEAVAGFRRATGIDPNHEGSRLGLERASAALAAADANQSPEAMMVEGLRLLDTEKDAARAVEKFREMLAKYPTHYGAVYQLARALDAAGRRAEARPVWERMLKMAVDARDTANEARIRRRLAASQP